jgi:glycosyltransferase involved in cell wall biosynthesis
LGMDVSVVIPAHNSARFIQHAIKSALEQTVPAREVLVVDDATTDDTPEIMTRLRGPIRYTQRERGTIGSARNLAIRQAQGEWIGFLDSDDAWMSRKLERVGQVAAQYPDAVAIVTGSLVRAQDGSESEQAPMAETRLGSALRYMNPLTPSATVVRRAAAESIGLFNETLEVCEDWDFFCRLYHAFPGRFRVLAEPLTWYRLSDVNRSRGYDFEVMYARALLDDVLLSGLRGWRRRWWRRRIEGAVLGRAGLMARDMGHYDRARELFWESVQKYPGPEFLFWRWKAALLSLR